MNPANPTPFSTSEAIRYGWQTLKQNFWFFVLILLIAGLISRAPGILIRDDKTVVITNLLLAFIIWVLQFLVNLGLTRIALLLHAGTKPVWKEIFSQYSLLLPYIGASLLYGLIVAFGTILFIIPGIIWGIKYAFFGFVMVDKHTGVMESLRLSAQLTAGLKWSLFVFSLAVIFLNILGAMALMIGLFVTIPITLMAAAHVYRRLENRLNQTVIASAAPATPTP